MIEKQSQDPDAIVIGTGFAGAVTACRLAQAGLRICVLERGRRYKEPDDFPKYPCSDPMPSNEVDRPEQTGALPPDFSRWSWALDQGLWDLRDLDDIYVAQAAGYGGGSLIYANVHLRAPDEVFEKTNPAGKRYWPNDYDRKTLNEYYDLAAYMLKVNPLPENLRNDLLKTRCMEKIPAQLQKESEKSSEVFVDNSALHFFYPPLAIDFKKCKLCAHCVQGCNEQAKNTLDYNYLDSAEKEGADIRTLAEVTSIKRKTIDSTYEVTYKNHLSEKEETINAKYVFLCAGAVNTTELLLRSYKDIESFKKKDSIDKIGTRFHPNADSIATVFDCERRQESDRGPTITSSLFYQRDKEDDKNNDKERKKEKGKAPETDWFLIQDGGLPTQLEPLLGVFRSPLLMNRNRYLEHEDADSLRERKVQLLPYAELPFSKLGDAIRALPRTNKVPEGVFDLENLEEKLSGYSNENSHKKLLHPRERPLWDLIPLQLKAALEDGRELLLDHIGLKAELLVGDMIQDVAVKMDNKYPGLLETLESNLSKEIKLPKKFKVQGISNYDIQQRAMTLAIQLLWGSEADMARAVVNRVFDEYIPKTFRELVDKAFDLAKWALDYRIGDGHTAILLAMGRDSTPGELYLKTTNSLEIAPLAIKLPKSVETPERYIQERVLRDIAKFALKGELRTNPAWSFFQRRITVHSQGGCPMGDEETQVTLHDGQVDGCPGLYVMDGAAFPASVGVNPSATITAIAEYKIEIFIRNVLNKTNWQAKEKPAAKQWAQGLKFELDPIAKVKMKNNSPQAKPVGIKFSEKMTGYHSGLNRWPDNLKRTYYFSEQAKENEEDNKYKLFDDYHRFKVGELGGIARLSNIDVELNVFISDLAKFLANADAGLPEKVNVSGEIGITGWPTEEDTPFMVDENTSFIQFFAKKPHQEPFAKKSERVFNYELDFKHKGKQYKLFGIKAVRDDKGFDVWRDLTTLAFILLEEMNHDKGKTKWMPLRSGILRLPAENFFTKQLPGMEVTGTKDPARQLWAFTAFGKFFAGPLFELYLPEFEQLRDAVKNIRGKTHD